jgi:hypothetical protein
MKNSVALLIAARTQLAVHDNRDEIVSNLCRTFDIGTDDALAIIAAAQLLADQPGQNNPLRVIDEIPIQDQVVADQTT